MLFTFVSVRKVDGAVDNVWRWYGGKATLAMANGNGLVLVGSVGTIGTGSYGTLCC